MFNNFKNCKHEVENQLEKKIKIQKCDIGFEYAPTKIVYFCNEHDIIHEVTPSYAPQCNGVVERKNRTLLNMVNATLLSFGLPINCSADALY